MCSETVTALYWLGIPIVFGLALLALGCIAQFVSWSSAAWNDLTDIERSFAATPSSRKKGTNHEGR